ncbi:MAG: 1-acyl-sn-glycerol-3-phosphate acyltransferase [Pseudomonadota bacterium]
MNTLRRVLHGTLYLGYTIFGCVAFLPFLVLPAKKLRALMVRIYFKLHDVIEPWFGLHYRKEGWEHLPDQPCLIALQHQTGWEAMRLPFWFRDFAIIMKIELFRMPLWGWYATRCDMIPIDRSLGKEAVPEMLRTAAEKNAQGRDIIIFPQGTRTPPGVHKELKTGIAKLYEHLQVPVVPVVLNSGVYTSKLGLVKKSGTITVRMLPAIEPGLSKEKLMEHLQAIMDVEGDRLLDDDQNSKRQNAAA